jgi:phage terminase Nu1 subunit (DNA packaging protein)
MADWDDVTVLRKRQEVPRTTKNQAVLNQARRTGAVVATERKCKTLGSTSIEHACTDY